jgi:tRNA A37 N6-isopentenylltransferase MiaA
VELRAEEATWQAFKNVFRQRFRDVHTDQFHSMRLQTAKQGKIEDPQAFADRCRALSQIIVQKSDDRQAQRIHQENAERMLLASFVTWLHGAPFKQVRYANPQTMKQALTITLSVQEAEKQERFKESFFSNFVKSVRVTRSPNSASSEHDSFSRSG